MNFGVVQVLLLVVCIHQTVSSKIERVKPRWIYTNNKNSNSKSLPDSIQVDLQLEGGNITLNLIRKVERSNKHPLILTKLGDQWTHMKGSEDEDLVIYNDLLLDASATVTIKKIDDFEEILYMITFNHGGKSFSVGPSSILENDLEEDDEAEDGKNNNIKSKLLNIDGVLHTLYETHTAKENNQMDEGHGKRIAKRSDKESKKRLMTVEIFTIVDFSTFDRFYNASRAKTHKERSEDSKKTIRYLFTHVFERVKNIYERIEHETLKFTVKWTGTMILESIDELPFMETSRVKLEVNTTHAFLEFKEWVANVKANKTNITLPRYDVAIVVTRHHMLGKDGATFPDVACGVVSNVALIKYRKFFAFTATIAHELGHTLGARHDDSGANSHCTDDASVMKGFLHDGIPNFIYFSNCSIKGFETRIQTLDRQNRNCLTDGGEDLVPAQERDFYLRLYPGQLYDHDDQCKLAYGPASHFVSGDNEGIDLCKWMHCREGNDPIPSTLMPMDGTTCSNRAWCRGGKCVPDGRAPKAPEQCIYGDYKFRIKSMGFYGHCKDHVQNPKVCLNFEKKCCLSCQGNGNKSESCEDTLDECSILEPRDCYYEYYAKSCCNKCRSLVQNPDDAYCLYGDRGTGCSKLVPTVCHLSTRFCCSSCASYRSTFNTTT